MKRATIFLAFFALVYGAKSQEAATRFNVSSDLVSRYVWRGLQLSNSPAIQPTLSYSTNGFTAGAWGSYAFNNIGSECDLFASYTAPFGLSVYFNDYYFPADPAGPGKAGYFDSKGGANHTFELGLSYLYKGFSISGYSYLNYKNDTYFEASYTHDFYAVFIGAGNKNYSTSENFNISNLGLKVFKTVAISEKFSIKPFASFIINPNKEQAYLIAGITLF